MARNFELDSLKAREQEAFHRKQSAFQKYVDAKERANTAHDTMQSAWEERCSAREEMNREFEDMRHSSDNYHEVWDEYGRIRDANNARIESLRYEADSEHQMMKDCFERASDAYEYGNKAEAPIYSAEGHDHKDRRDELNEEISRLVQEIRDAKANAEWRAPKTDSSAFHKAKEMFNNAKARHESAENEFKRLKAERDYYKAEFNSAQEEHVRLKEEFQKKLAEVKANNQRKRDRTLDRAGVRWSDRKDAKIVKKTDGTTQIYHGGLGSGDGLGHGHTALDQFGNKTYERDAFEEHGYQNFTDNSKGVTMYDRNARPGHEVKGISGGVKLKPNSSFRGENQNWYKGKKPGVIGHSTQFYDDGVRLSRETKDGVHEINTHWTDTRLPKGHPGRHEKPDD
ncbi:DUF1771 domain-containing protein [Candidatus Saccharibacteria bacterium]|nr:DUF1771 domain-containing protein [Candidatus Saccharibacteria bacterium]